MPATTTDTESPSRIADLEEEVAIYRAMLEQLPHMVWAKDVNGRFVFANQKVIETAGLDSIADIIGKTSHEAFPPKQANRCKAGDQRALESGKPIIHEHPWAEGWMESGRRVLKGKDSAPAGVIGFACDVSCKRKFDDIQSHGAALERRLTRLAASAPGVIYSHRRTGPNQGYFPYVSPSVIGLLGIPPRDLENGMEALLNVIHPTDASILDLAIEAASANLSPYRTEFRVHHHNNGERWIMAQGAPEQEADGSILWHGFMLDITDQVQHRFQLDLTTHAMNQTDDAVYLIDEHMRILQVNDGACRTLGYSRDELTKLGVADINAEMSHEVCSRVWHQLETAKGSVRFETHHRAKGGRAFPVDVTASRFEYRGRNWNLCLARDATARKRLEEEIWRREKGFRTLADNSPDYIIRYDREGRRIYCNQAMTNWVGVPLNEFLGHRPVEQPIHPPEVAEGYEARIRQVINNAESGEIELTWEKDGLPVYLQVRIVPEYDDEGMVSGALAVGRDISALKQAETRLRTSHDILRALALHQEREHEEDRRKLSNQIHEDLAQNLSALRLNISMLGMNEALAPHADALATMQDITERCIVRSRDMVSMLRPTVLNIGLVPTLRWLADDFHKGMALNFDMNLPEEDLQLDDKIATFLFRVAQESLINTALHAAATHVRMALRLEDGWIHLSLSDNGLGFDPSSPRAPDTFGLIGLAEQARSHGGELKVTSATGQGTTLDVSLPLAPSSETPT
jgi:PAS domain S-box-containing protein